VGQGEGLRLSGSAMNELGMKRSGLRSSAPVADSLRVPGVPTTPAGRRHGLSLLVTLGSVFLCRVCRLCRGLGEGGGSRDGGGLGPGWTSPGRHTRHARATQSNRCGIRVPTPRHGDGTAGTPGTRPSRAGTIGPQRMSCFPARPWARRPGSSVDPHQLQVVLFERSQHHRHALAVRELHLVRTPRCLVYVNDSTHHSGGHRLLGYISSRSHNVKHLEHEPDPTPVNPTGTPGWLHFTLSIASTRAPAERL